VASGSGSSSGLSLSSLLQTYEGNKVEGWSGVGGGSYARTPWPNPWRQASSVAVAPTFPLYFSSSNNSEALDFGCLVRPGCRGGGRKDEVQESSGVPSDLAAKVIVLEFLLLFDMETGKEGASVILVFGA
jgi:hypothetical protein